MIAKVSIDEVAIEQLQQTGELRVEDPRGVQLILMTLDARQQLHGIAFDDSEMTEVELMGVLATQVNDPEGMGAPGMEVYDTKYGHLFDDTYGKDQ